LSSVYIIATNHRVGPS